MAEGWWNSFTLDRPATLGEFERSEAFWVSLGSFGVPMVAIGCYILRVVRQKQRIPRWLGWLLLAWGSAIVTALPASPGWAIPIAGGLLVLGREESTPAPPHSPVESLRRFA